MSELAATPRGVGALPETSEAHPEVPTHDSEAESNPFTSRDWRLSGYAWSGFLVRLLVVAGGLFSAYEYLENKQEKRVERTLQLVEAWERNDYQDAQHAIAERLDALNVRYADLLGGNVSPQERAVYMERIGSEAMTADGGEKSLAKFRGDFDRILYFLNRIGFCVEGNLCARSMTNDYFGDYALSFWQYFRGYVMAERKAGSTGLAAPLEAFIAQLPASTQPAAK